MAVELTYEEQEQFAETFELLEQPVRLRVRISESLLGIGLLASIAWMWGIAGSAHLRIGPALLCFGVFVVAQSVRFDTPFGYLPATQVAFVPLLFAVPLGLVPLAVIAGIALSETPRLFTSGRSPARLFRSIPNACYAFGPTAVFIISGTQPDHAGAGLLVLALISQFAVDAAASTIRGWAEHCTNLSTQLRQTAWVYAGDSALSVVGLLVAEDLHVQPIVALAPLPLLGLLSLFASERRQRVKSLLELNNAYHGTAMVLGDVVEADDSYTGEHCRMVVGLAMAVGHQLGMGAEERRNLEFAALLHDVGKVTIPKEIINKPGKLDAEEWAIMQTHTVEGQRILNRVGGSMCDVGVIVRAHHERWDGGGYPDGLAGKDIPLASRIITCCDSWNAMRTDRVYRAKLPFEEARRELTDHTGAQFDPCVVEAFMRIVQSEDDEAAVLGNSMQSA